MTDIPWQEVHAARAQAARTLKPLHRCPLVADSRQVLLRELVPGASLLDVGANDRNVERYLRGKGADVRYFSCDIDRTLSHDYYGLDEVDRRFDAACLFDVIEHVSPTQALSMLAGIHRLLEPGGRVLVTTPNVDHPTRFWRDATHITPFRYDELAGFLIAAGFTDVRILRVARLKWQDRLRRLWAAPVLRLLGIDFAPSILALARRPL